ncbi:olfactory receptor 10A7-like [Dendropsophus ebraccatus]|uniref:olfactory receptor 10A7-like n=1 Tax=Dendropsophus ebraccatus TaxID=150705 RepID=UPI00383144BA
MCEVNQTEVTEFLLLGFKGLHEIKILLFIVFLLVYIVIVIGNLLIVVLVSTMDRLKIPMFIFLKHLATADVLLTTTVVPAMLDIILVNQKKILVGVCIMQMYFIFIFGFVQCFFIAIMSYDRCLAICNPMHYTAIMSPRVCVMMVRGSWSLVLIISSEIILVCQLQFCYLSHIDSFFCDFGPLIELATSDTSVLLLVDFIVSILMIFLPFAFTIITYMCICVAILSISSTSGRSKAFSTCSSHLATVCAYYGTLMTASLNSFDKASPNLNKFTSLLYIVVTPLLNPIIYSLRNQEIKRTLQKISRNFRLKNY